MPCTLTDYQRPPDRYREEARATRWRGLGGWHLCDDRAWRRVYVCGRRGVARRAAVYQDGGWKWKIEAFDRRAKTIRTIVNRSHREAWYVSAAAAFPWADVAARLEY